MPRILIIDDDKCITETLSEFCKDLGYEPIPIDDPSFCSLPCVEHKICPKETPCADALLVDQYLPSTFGLTFIDDLKSRGCLIPAGSKALISGSLSSEEKERAKKLGYDVLLKPITFDILKNWLNSNQSNVV